MTQPDTAPLFELGGLFATVDTLATTPLDELELPREIAPGLIVAPSSTPAEPRRHYWPDLDPTRPENRQPEPCTRLTPDRRPEYVDYCALCMHPIAAHVAPIPKPARARKPEPAPAPVYVDPPRCHVCPWADNDRDACPGRGGFACSQTPPDRLL